MQRPSDFFRGQAGWAFTNAPEFEAARRYEAVQTLQLHWREALKSAPPPPPPRTHAVVRRTS